jgi:hypothetical protein
MDPGSAAHRFALRSVRGTLKVVIARSAATKQSILRLASRNMDCFAEPVIGRASARPGGCVPSMIDSLEVKVFYPA